MKELLVSIFLVLIVAVGGFVGLDQLGGPTNQAHANAAPAVLEPLLVSAPPAPAGNSQMVERHLHLLYAPDQRLAVDYDAAHWYPLEYMRLATLELQRVAGCRLELESSGEPVRVSGQWAERVQRLGEHRFVVSSLTPDGSTFARQVFYTTADRDAYVAFTLTIGESVQSRDAFESCQGEAESILATLHRLE